MTEEMQVPEDKSPKKRTRNRNARIILTVTAIILLLMIVAACALLGSLLGIFGNETDDTGEIGWIRSIYSIGPNIEDQISPARAAVGPGGNHFYITDQGNARIIRLTPNFQVDGVFYEANTNGGAYDGTYMPFYFPSGIAVAQDNGDIIVTRMTYGDFWVMNSSMELQFIRRFPEPSAVAVNRDMIVVGGIGGFAAYERDGTPIGLIGFSNATSEPDGFDYINGLALDTNNNVYVVDTYNTRLSKYDNVGNQVWLQEIGPPRNRGIDSNKGLDAAQLAELYPGMAQMPMQMTIDGAGRLVLIDFHDFTVQAYSPEDGSFLGKWGVFGSGDGQIYYASGIAYDAAQDAFILTDTGVGRAQLITVPGSGGNLITGLNRALRGPLSMCLIPLLIIILGLIAYTILRSTQKRRERLQLEQAIAASGADELMSADVISDGGVGAKT